MSGRTTHQNPKYRVASLPKDRLEQYSDDQKMILVDGTCEFTLDRNAQEGNTTLLVLGENGDLTLVAEDGATLLGPTTATGEGARMVVMCYENRDGQNAKFLSDAADAP